MTQHLKAGSVEGLVEKLETNVRGNALDLAVELALFEPDKTYSAARLNNAETKVIYTLHDGSEETCWAWDWSMEPWRTEALAILKARLSLTLEGEGGALRPSASVPAGGKPETEGQPL